MACATCHNADTPMAGIYIHVPFCARRCIYCDFYSTTCVHEAERYADALAREIEQRAPSFASGDAIRTVYVGGGTPSLLSPAIWQRVFARLAAAVDLSQATEITFEANPEDITDDYARALAELTPVNRVSMGVQSFIDTELHTLRRRHNAARPAEAVGHLRRAGIGNISLDLMYGLPGQTVATWQESIRRAVALNIEHISAYCLSIESGTRLARALRDGALTLASEDDCLTMSATLRQTLAAAGFEQYEISNFARPGHRSLHNSNYWNGTPYLGLGPGAHSYDGAARRTWNAPDLRAYLDGRRVEEGETLTATDRYNESIMLALRTRDGLSVARLRAQFHSEPHLLAHFARQLRPLLRRGWLALRPSPTVWLDEDAVAPRPSSCPTKTSLPPDECSIALTAQGLPLADEAIRTLFYV